MLRVEVWVAWDLDILKEMLMSFRRDGGRKHGTVFSHPDLVMRSCWRDDKQERLRSIFGEGIQNLDRLVRDDIRLVQALIAGQRSIVDGKDGVVEGIDVGCDERFPVGGVKPLGCLFESGRDTVDELSDVVVGVSCLL